MSLARRLVSGTSQLTISSGLVRLLSIATLPILTSLLAPRAYGVAALAGTVISLVSVFALAGIDMSYSRAFYSSVPPSGEAVEHYCWRFAVGSALITALIAGIGWWFITIRSPELESSLGALVGAGIFLSVVHSMSGTRARLAGRYGAIAAATVASGALVAVASISIAMFWRRDALALLVPMLLGYLLPVVFLGTPAISSLRSRSRLSREEGVALVKVGLAGVITAPMFWLLSSSDRWFLQRYQGAETVGIYSVGYSVAMIGMMINSAVMSVWLPEAAQEYERSREQARMTLGRLMSRLIAGMGLIWLAATAAGGDAVRWLANERFHAATAVVPLIAGGVLFYGVSLLAMHTLVLVNQLKWAAAWWFGGGVISLVLNLSLVPVLGMMGAALTQAISFFFIGAAILITSQNRYRLHLEWPRLVAALSLTLIAGIIMTPAWHETAPVSIAIKFPCGVVVAMIAAAVIAPDWVSRAIRKVRRKPPSA